MSEGLDFHVCNRTPRQLMVSTWLLMGSTRWPGRVAPLFDPHLGFSLIFDLATIDPVAREGWVVAADSVESRHCVHAPHSELGEQLGLSDSRMVILSHLKYVTAKNKTGVKSLNNQQLLSITPYM